jgi:hypothetical protein
MCAYPTDIIHFPHNLPAEFFKRTLPDRVRTGFLVYRSPVTMLAAIDADRSAADTLFTRRFWRNMAAKDAA